MSVRKAHNSGRNHLRNVVDYYQRMWHRLQVPMKRKMPAYTDYLGSEIGQEKAQSVIDSITSSYAAEGKAVPNPAMVPPGALPPPPFGFPGLSHSLLYKNGGQKKDIKNQKLQC